MKFNNDKVCDIQTAYIGEGSIDGANNVITMLHRTKAYLPGRKP